MIARRELSEADRAFNARWGAPKGRTALRDLVRASVARRLRFDIGVDRSLGPFCRQPDNNATRIAEYAWAARAVPLHESHVVVDVGGSLGGLQFVLAKTVKQVINVDPGLAAEQGWAVSRKIFDRMNTAHGTAVELREAFLDQAGFSTATIDTIYCISTIEHIAPADAERLLREMYRILRPGGHAVLTIDLFFDLAPFTTRVQNVHGTNIDVKRLIDTSGLILIAGDPRELNGFSEFDPVNVLGNGMKYAQGDVALNCAQTIVLQKPLEDRGAENKAAT